MKAKEKALNLLSKFYYSKDEDGFHSMNKYRAKQCALIAVDEMIEESIGYLSIDRNKYWKEVQQEIEKL